MPANGRWDLIWRLEVKNVRTHNSINNVMPQKTRTINSNIVGIFTLSNLKTFITSIQTEFVWQQHFVLKLMLSDIKQADPV
jgi:hypothetical protein